MADSRPGTGLQTLFAIFLGLMLTAFLGVGVYTFYPPPEPEFRTQIEKLDRDQQAIRLARPDDSLSAADRAHLQKLNDERNKLYDASRDAREHWCSITSIILVSLATLTMVVSLAAAPSLPVITNGLLIGGVFTMIYGVGWVIASGTSTARFVVMTFALIITLGLGYMRFVNRRGIVPAPSGGGATMSSAELADLEQRVQSLEERLAQAASVLNGPK